MPIDDAVDFMKAAAKKSYGKKGDAVVEMNYKAIDAGVDAVHKVEVRRTTEDCKNGRRFDGSHLSYGRRQPSGFRICRKSGRTV